MLPLKVKKNVGKSGIENYLFCSIIENVPDIIFVVNPDGTILYVNRSIEHLGFKQTDLIGKKNFAFIHPQDIKKIYEGLKESLSHTGRSKKIEVKALHKNGSFRDFELNATTIIDKDGSIKVIGNARDITYRKRLEELLRQSETRYKTIFQHATKGIGLIDLKGKFLEVNPALENLSGYSKKELLQMYFADILDQRDAKKIWKLFIKHQQGKKGNTQIKARIIKKDKNIIWVEIFGSIIRDKNNNPLYGIGLLEDISQRLETEAKKKEFISSASHELKTPITTSKLIVQTLLYKNKKYKLEKSLHDNLDILDRQLNRLTGLINDMLDVSKFETGKFKLRLEETDLELLIERAIKHANIILKGRKIIFRKSNRYKIRIDPDRIEQVLNNLIYNADKYSLKNNKITVYTEKKGKKVVVSIKDEGIGIPKSKLPYLFDQFYRVNETSKEGFGLGLYICKNIIKKHKGRIWVESELGKGSVFHFSLPIMN